MQSLAHRLSMSSRRPRPGPPVPIALVITDLDVGGAERALVALVTGLDRARWSPAVLCLGPEGALAGVLRKAGVPVECLDVRRKRPLQAVLRLSRALRGHRPEIVQSFLFHANLAAKLAAPLAGRPWVVGGLRVAERQKRWHLLLDRLTQPLSAGSVCVSKGVERFSRDAGRLAPDRLTVIPNGIDPAPYDAARPIDRRALGVPDPDAMLALFAGRLERQKGVDVLIHAAIACQGDAGALHLLIAGDGPDRPALERLAGGDDRIHWLGPRDDMPALLAAADLLVLPSRWEGMPNVVLEAMAARRAVIATAVEGSEDLVVPGHTGWLVPPGDVPALAGALREAVANPALLSTFGERARQRVEREFSQRAVIAAYDRLWSAVLGYADESDGARPGLTDPGGSL